MSLNGSKLVIFDWQPWSLWPKMYFSTVLHVDCASEVIPSASTENYQEKSAKYLAQMLNI